MSIRTKITLVMLTVFSVGFIFFARNETEKMSRRYRESTEEPIVDLVYILSKIVAVNIQNGDLNLNNFRTSLHETKNLHISARIYDYLKQNIDLRILFTNSKGVVIIDSNEINSFEGLDFSGWTDVAKALRGEYGARTSHENGKDSDSIMYISAPVIVNDKVAGVITASKSNKTANLFIKSANSSLTNAAIYILLATLLLTLLLSSWVTRPIKLLTLYVEDLIKNNEVKIPNFSKGEINDLYLSFKNLKAELEGKKYVERYILTITHALKSPITSIRGSAEILKEKNISEFEKNKFTETILNEIQRLDITVNKLLYLTTLQSERVLSDFNEVNLFEIISGAITDIIPAGKSKNIKVNFINQVNSQNLIIKGNSGWLIEAFKNILQNAIEFSPKNSIIDVNVNCVDTYFVITFNDNGPGIPDWAINKIWDQFFSLPRPDSNNKSSGLGLSIVREIINKHNGNIGVKNLDVRGLEVKVKFLQFKID